MDADQRAHLRALLAKATPGPWCVDDSPYVTVGRPMFGKVVARVLDRSDRTLIAAARTALPALLDALDDAEARVSREPREPRERRESSARARAFAALVRMHDEARGLGQTHAVVAGAAEWARTRNAGVLFLVASDERVALDIARRVAFAMPAGVLKLPSRSVASPAGAVVRVVTIAQFVDGYAGWRGPVLLDGSVTRVFAARAVQFDQERCDAERERDSLRAEVDRLRRLLDDAMRVLNLAPGVHSSRTVAEHIERTLYPERFAVERAASGVDGAPATGCGALHSAQRGGMR